MKGAKKGSTQREAAHKKIVAAKRQTAPAVDDTASDLPCKQSVTDNEVLNQNNLRVANKYNRTLLEVNLDPLVTIDSAGKIMDVNSAAELVTGMNRRELIGTIFCSYFTEPEKATDGYLKVFSEGTIRNYPLTIKNISGCTTDVLLNASVYRNDRGEVEGVFAAAHDITEIKKAQERIKLQAEWHDTMLATTPDGFWVLNTAGKLLDVNDAYLKLSGYEREEFLKLSIPDIEAVETPEEISLHIAKVLATGFDRFETRHRKKNGQLFDVEISVSYWKKNNQFLLFARDITERKTAEAKAAAERKRFNDVLEMLPVYVILLSPDYYVRHSNRYFNERFGNHMGKHCYEYLFNFSEPCVKCETYKTLETKKPQEWEWTGPDGRNYYIYDFPFTDVDGSELIMEMGIDITELKQAEQEIRKLNEELEKRVNHRTAELQFANQELEAFSYSVSHDLRTPLTVIDGFAKILQKDISDKLDEEYKTYLKKIISASEKMTGLIIGLLNFSRISRVQLHRRKVRLDETAKEILARLKKSEPGRDVKTVIQKDIIVYADPNLISIVMENLINNAWKFTRNTKQAEIEIGRMQSGPDAVFYVKDNGAGFDMNLSDKLFNPFQRLHDQKKFEGSGVGLATVKRIITRHGGKIWADSETDKGAAFFFTIPIC